MMDKQVIASASSYNKKYFFSPLFDDLPKEVKEEIRIICVVIAEKIHGIFSVGVYNNGDVFFETMASANDFDYDEIGAKLEIKKLELEKSELIKQISLWYKITNSKTGLKE